jgi:hypothetical protein
VPAPARPGGGERASDDRRGWSRSAAAWRVRAGRPSTICTPLELDSSLGRRSAARAVGIGGAVERVRRRAVVEPGRCWGRRRSRQDIDRLDAARWPKLLASGELDAVWCPTTTRVPPGLLPRQRPGKAMASRSSSIDPRGAAGVVLACSSAPVPESGERRSPVVAGARVARPAGPSTAACFRAFYLACLRSRRSRTAFSQFSFFIAVFLELDAARVHPFVWIPSASMTRKPVVPPGQPVSDDCAL